ncbi:MAG: hypothetical protein U1F57_05445 [bacterium]
MLSHSRSGEVFTDTRGRGFNNGKAGFSVATGLDLGLMETNRFSASHLWRAKCSWSFPRFSKHNVVQATSALLAKPQLSNVPLTELNVSVNPKLKFDTLGRFRPGSSPSAWRFSGSHSPPSNDTTYLDLGLNFGAGLDVPLAQMAQRSGMPAIRSGLNEPYEDLVLFDGVYAGINF